LEQLTAQTNETPKHIAHWLDCIATVHIRRNDLASARAAVRRIISKFPDSPVAETAGARLMGLEGELKGLKKSSAIKMGSYERDMGLKQSAE